VPLLLPLLLKRRVCADAFATAHTPLTS
jgi:hypothetical protein